MHGNREPRRAWRREWAALLAGLVWIATIGTASASLSPISLSPNETKVIKPGYPVANVSVGNPGICDVTPVGSDLLLTAKSPGRTKLTIWNRENGATEEAWITVGGGGGTGCGTLQSLLGGIPGVEVKSVGGQCVVDGRVGKPEDLKRIALVTSGSGALNLVTADPVMQEVIAEQVQSEIGAPGVRVRSAGNNIVLEGVVYSDAEAQRALTLARAYTDRVVNVLTIRPMSRPTYRAPIVEITATFIEASQEALDALGIRWTPGSGLEVQASGDSLGDLSSVTGTITGFVSNLFPHLITAGEEGYLRVLETIAVSTKSGEKAEIFSGGEIGVRVADKDQGNSVQFKEIGIRLAVEPVADQGQSVDMRITGEISALGQPTPGGLINITKSNVTTTQYCKSGQSIVIGGLIRDRKSLVYDQVPSNAEGAIFTLIKSKEFQQQKTHLVLALTPRILDAPEKGLETIKQQTDQELQTIETIMR